MNAFTAMLKDEQGAALTEYALILALLAVAAIVAVQTLSSGVQAGLNNASQQLQNSQTSG